MICAQIFGASAAYDAFLLAFRIPNFLRRFVGEGALSQAFVPVLSEYQNTRPKEEVQNLINHVGGHLIVVLFIMTVLGCLGAPILIKVCAPGFAPEGNRAELATYLLRITFPYIFFISLTSFLSAILNTYGRFAAPAFAPVLLNVALIIATLFICPYFDNPVEGLAWGVLLGGVLQLLFQWPFIRQLKLSPRLKVNWKEASANRVLKLMLPALFGASVMQVNLLIGTMFASFLPVGSVSWLYYTDRLLEFPSGIFGVALATVILPHLSTHYANKSPKNFSNSIDWALRWTLLIGLPASIGLIMLAPAIITTLFHYGAFSENDVWMTVQSLRTLSIGLIAFIVIKVLVSAFYARQNTRFPVYIALTSIVMNVIFSALLMGPLAHAGLTLATSLASILNVIILLVVLLRSKIYVMRKGWGLFVTRLSVANGFMIFALWQLTPPFEDWLDFSATDRGLWLGALILSSVIIFFGSLWLSGVRKPHLGLEKVLETGLE
jgi:putative peptidoglycan lipid II flippase